ncbi:conjugal transfer transcriptional regulator TraJ [Salmonella enterica]|nr:conjugal transfer transcriptional regulator TraJ [Salmonella enterica]
MYPTDRIQQRHDRQINLLENFITVIQCFPNPACIRDVNGNFLFCNSLFRELFLKKTHNAEKWLLSQTDFCELISITEMEACRNENTHLNLIENVCIQNRLWTISVQLFCKKPDSVVIWEFFDTTHVRYTNNFKYRPHVDYGIKKLIVEMRDNSSVSSSRNDVFYLYSSGLSHRAISKKLNISVATSKKHASFICSHFSVKNRDSLIILLYKKNFMQNIFAKAVGIINNC